MNAKRFGKSRPSDLVVAEIESRLGLAESPIDHFNVSSTRAEVVRKTASVFTSLDSTYVSYRRRDSNPQGGNPPGDFKSPASAIPPRRLGSIVPEIEMNSDEVFVVRL